MWSRRDPSLHKSGVDNIVIRIGANLLRLKHCMIHFLLSVTSFHARWFVMKMVPRVMDLYILRPREQLKGLLKK